MEAGQKGELKCIGCKEKTSDGDRRRGARVVTGRGKLTLQNRTLMGAGPYRSRFAC